MRLSVLTSDECPTRASTSHFRMVLDGGLANLKAHPPRYILNSGSSFHLKPSHFGGLFEVGVGNPAHANGQELHNGVTRSLPKNDHSPPDQQAYLRNRTSSSSTTESRTMFV